MRKVLVILSSQKRQFLFEKMSSSHEKNPILLLRLHNLVKIEMIYFLDDLIVSTRIKNSQQCNRRNKALIDDIDDNI